MIDHTPIQVLDSGYVQLVETWGSDERIIEAARMSTGKGFQGWGVDGCQPCDSSWHDRPMPVCPRCHRPTTKTKGDEKLLAYLYTHRHMTPFEMCGMIIEVKAPIVVFREWHRHRTQSYNEMSGRYIPLPDENYLPNVLELMPRILGQGTNKQAGAVNNRVPTSNEVAEWLAKLESAYFHTQHVYRLGLELGIPKEVARLCVPVARYSRMRASANLRNWLHFLSLRMDHNAQWEIRQYANAVGELVRQWFPRTWALFTEEVQ